MKEMNERKKENIKNIIDLQKKRKVKKMIILALAQDLVKGILIRKNNLRNASSKKDKVNSRRDHPLTSKAVTPY